MKKVILFSYSYKIFTFKADFVFIVARIMNEVVALNGKHHDIARDAKNKKTKFICIWCRLYMFYHVESIYHVVCISRVMLKTPVIIKNIMNI